jgi:hypothetical protein
MDDKEKTLTEKFVGTVSNAVGGVVKAAVLPTHEPEAVAETANEPMLAGDAAIAPEAIPALGPTAPEKAFRSKKLVAAKPSAKKSKKTAAKTTAKKSSKKAAKRAVKKTAKKSTKKAVKKDAKKSKHG